MTEIYKLYAKKLLDQIEFGDTFFSGYFFDKETTTALKLMLVVYRDIDGNLADIVPVWWEFKPWKYNDELFSFDEFKGVFLSLTKR